MSVGLFRPHVPMFVPQKWFDLYDRDSIVLPDNPLSDLEDVPPNFVGLKQIAPSHVDVVKHDVWRGMVHAYLASTSFVDACVGIVLDGLEQGPHKENTIVVLWSDHGFHLGEKQHWAKRTLWEESTRVPFLIAGPGIEPGEACREPVSLLDVYPTLVDLCGLPEAAHLEGLSLRPQLDDPNAGRERPAVISSYFGNHAIRSRDWRYIQYADGAEELYDHRIDPDEYTNLAGNPDHDEVKRELQKWIPKDAAPELKPFSEQDPNAPKKKKK
ncbi:MAG: sulfatase-like hydrolase/transferase, partial [Verrucomicrobiales bacterium]|nr:sulfatase-like hydrolase/transferase [Verrucomicrobiales bacterium]